VLHDPQLEVTVAFSEYAEHDAVALDAAVGRLALGFATTCLAQEFVRNAGGCTSRLRAGFPPSKVILIVRVWEVSR
jgi:hypothetical protein